MTVLTVKILICDLNKLARNEVQARLIFCVDKRETVKTIVQLLRYYPDTKSQVSY